MKYIKTYKSLYESVNEKELQIGDYVICSENDPGSVEEIQNFINNNIGKFIRYRIDTDTRVSLQFDHMIQYEYVPPEIIEEDFDFGENSNEYNTRLMKKSEIKYWSENKEDLEQLLLNNKFNI